MGTGTRLGLIALLLIAIGLFMAAEFGLLAARRGRVDAALRREGGAKFIRTAWRHIDRYLSATQLGVALASLSLAWILEPVLAAAIGRIISSVGWTPPTALSHSIAVLALAVAVGGFVTLLVMRTRFVSARDQGAAIVTDALDFHDKKARDVMRPRTEIVALPEDSTEDDVWAAVRAERYSRYPVYRDSLDDVVGVFLAKDLWLHPDTKPFVLRDYIRPALYVPDNRPAERVMDDLRKRRAHLAVVLDEYAGTAGIITLEDLIEEVMGDINDEYDFATRQAVESNGVLELAGSLSLVDVRSDYGLRIPDGDWNTLGGYVFGELGRVPRMGDRVHFAGGDLEVVAMDGRRVAAVRVIVSGDGGPPDTGRATQPAGAALRSPPADTRPPDSSRLPRHILTDREVPL